MEQREIFTLRVKATEEWEMKDTLEVMADGDDLTFQTYGEIDGCPDVPLNAAQVRELRDALTAWLDGR